MCMCVFILISLATSLSFASVPDNGVSDCGHRNGNYEEIKCRNGIGCIRTEHICDGTPDCPDASDELLCPFHPERDLQSNLGWNRSRRQLTCPSGQWQCKNGYCISKNRLCDQVSDCSDNSDEASPLCRKRAIATSGVCVLPPYPEQGTYDVEDIPDARPGQAHSSVVLTVRCRRGYGVMDLYGDGSGIQQVYCVNGKWYQNMPKCVRFCKLDPDPSIRYMCYTPGTGITFCRNYVSPGTVVEPACNSPIYYAKEVLRNMKCISGVWDNYAECKVECGRITPGGQPLLIGGKEAKHGELPWHAAIYRRAPEVFMQICSGSLVSNNVVISAAHCFWKDLIKLLPASQFGVAVGKLHRSWNSEEDFFAQKSNVNEIRIEKLYDGVAANFQEDIAVLILSTPFNYTTYIRPVCLDFNLNFENFQLQDGVYGKLAGWGLTSPNGPPSESLKVLSLPFINEDTCISTLPDAFRGYITGDKFCAGYTNGKCQE
ncbi:unnamed protein product [Arctia plantaginis]|uniref:Uncharacterized protein n=1 Tax=Arctia plantaginis TaxID=874455 RepID=A0A8S0YT24_ARCPL|nr:unnamed protein product [Arctia plantaginis]